MFSPFDARDVAFLGCCFRVLILLAVIGLAALLFLLPTGVLWLWEHVSIK
jgi:hypothetical protein